jgi:hypothetical protein
LSYSKDSNLKILLELVNSGETLFHEQKSGTIHLMHSTFPFVDFKKNKNTIQTFFEFCESENVEILQHCPQNLKSIVICRKKEYNIKLIGI